MSGTEPSGPQTSLPRGGIRSLLGTYPALAILALAVLLQATVLARLRFFGACPNLLLAVVVSWSMLSGFNHGVAWGLMGGVGVDLIAGMPLGASSLGLMSTCFLAGLGKSSVFASNILLPMLIVALATPINGWVIRLTQQILGTPVNWIETTVRVIGPEMLLNAVTITVTYPLMRWFAGKLGPKPMSW